MSIQQAHQYEQAYHENLYAQHGLFEPGSWLYKPAAYVLQSLGLVPPRMAVRALDLGCGVGRHSIPLAQHFGSESEIVCVDMLPTAIKKLASNAQTYGVAKNITGIVSDVEGLPADMGTFDFVLSASCIEHVPTQGHLTRLIRQLQTQTTSNGIHCFMMITDNTWIDTVSGKSLTPILEQNLDSAETTTMLQDLYANWTIHDLSTKQWESPQLIDGRTVILGSTCVQFTAQNAPSAG